jgi:hypothetical protein
MMRPSGRTAGDAPAGHAAEPAGSAGDAPLESAGAVTRVLPESNAAWIPVTNTEGSLGPSIEECSELESGSEGDAGGRTCVPQPTTASTAAASTPPPSLLTIGIHAGEIQATRRGAAERPLAERAEGPDDARESSSHEVRCSLMVVTDSEVLFGNDLCARRGARRTQTRRVRGVEFFARLVVAKLELPAERKRVEFDVD